MRSCSQAMTVLLFSLIPEILEDSMSTVNPQDIAAIVSFPDWSEELWPVMDTVVVVDGVQDPGNLGSIIRSTLASGAKAVFCLKGTVDFSNKKVLRSTMGTIFKLPVYMIEDVEEIVQVLKKYGFKFIVADADGRRLRRSLHRTAGKDRPRCW